MKRRPIHNRDLLLNMPTAAPSTEFQNTLLGVKQSEIEAGGAHLPTVPWSRPDAKSSTGVDGLADPM
jgi:hypothetical protein